MVTLRQAATAAAAAESHTLEGGINFGPRSLAAKGHTGTGRRAPTTNTITTTNSALGVYVLLCPITGFWYVCVCVCVCVHTAVVSSLCVRPPMAISKIYGFCNHIRRSESTNDLLRVWFSGCLRRI